MIPQYYPESRPTYDKKTKVIGIIDILYVSSIILKLIINNRHQFSVGYTFFIAKYLHILFYNLALL